MAYKIYISTTNNEECAPYHSAIKQALYRINEFPIAAIDMHDTQDAGVSRLTNATHLIEQADIFIGLYGRDYGDVPEGETRSFAELEYAIARRNEKICLIFALDGAYDAAEERQKAFLRFVMENHVVNTFRDVNDLAAQVKKGIDTYRKMRRDRLDQDQGLGGGGEAPHNDFEAQVQRAIRIASDDIEQIVRRSLELHDAQAHLHQSHKPSPSYVENEHDGTILARPLWGEPTRRSQFQSDVFMIMPFRERYNAIYQDVVRPVATKMNLSIKRGDEFVSTRGAIMQEVWAAIYGSRLVIAETTEPNPNVFYELGIAHTLGKPAILLTQTTEIDQLPFDLRHLRFLVYDGKQPNYERFKADLKHAIIWILNDLQEQVDQ